MISKQSILIAKNTKLTENFTLWEMIRTRHYSLMEPMGKEMVNRLTLLCECIYQPIRDRFGSYKITSGYRTPALNLKVGGAGDSDHMYGGAGDGYPGSEDILMVFAWAAKMLPYRQLIYYPKRKFLHISINLPGRDYKKEVLIL